MPSPTCIHRTKILLHDTPLATPMAIRRARHFPHLFACRSPGIGDSGGMTKRLSALIVALLFLLPHRAPADVLIVADEFPAMEVLRNQLREDERLTSQLVRQDQLPQKLDAYSAVVVYIHKALGSPAEKAFIHYAEGGGKLVVLHHSISSGKRTNDQWFQFLGVALPTGEFSQGGYQWIEPATLDILNLNPDHFITTNGVHYPKQIRFRAAALSTGWTNLPAFTLPDSEVYLNHQHKSPHTLLLGLNYRDPKTGLDYQQTTAGWIKPAGRGWVIYLMAGHRREDFEDPAYSRIVRNAVIFQP